MRNTGQTRDPIAVFPPPYLEAESVAPVRAEFDRIALERAACKGEFRDALDAKKAAPKAEARLAADAILAAKEPPEPSLERLAHENVVRLERRLEALTVALDDAGDRLADELGATKEQTLAAYVSVEAEAQARFRAALAEATEALTEIGMIASSRAWWDEFTAHDAKVGLVRAFHGSPLIPRYRPMMHAGVPADAVALLKAAASTLEPPPVREKASPVIPPVVESARGRKARSYA